jgi:hypothetical protein
MAKREFKPEEMVNKMIKRREEIIDKIADLLMQAEPYDVRYILEQAFIKWRKKYMGK